MTNANKVQNSRATMTRSQRTMCQSTRNKMIMLYMCLLLLIVVTFIGRSNKQLTGFQESAIRKGLNPSKYSINDTIKSPSVQLTGFQESAIRKGLNPSKDSINDTIKSPGVAIFYNIFVPPNDLEGKLRSYHIIKEQMGQVAKSAAVTKSENVTIYYISIGEVFDVALIDNVCDSLQIECVHVSHHATGYEMITEQAILDFCNEPGNDLQIVSYIHDKGTFSLFDRQNQNRRMLTKAALSHDCMDRLARDECNVCGFNFKGKWLK